MRAGTGNGRATTPLGVPRGEPRGRGERRPAGGADEEASSRARRRAATWASSVATDIISSARSGSQIPGTVDVSRCLTPSSPWNGLSGWTPTRRTRGAIFFRYRPAPTNVPVVPRHATKWVMVPRVWSQISGPVDSKWARQFASLLYWSRYRYVSGFEATRFFAAFCAPSVPSAAGVRTSFAQYPWRIFLRSALTFAGTHRVT